MVIIDKVLMLFMAAVTLVWIIRLIESCKELRSSFILRNKPSSELSLPSLPPKISILIPARNEEKNIAQCLAHIMNQDYKNYEVIIIDDRSTDTTAEIVRRFQRDHGNLKLISTASLPGGWTGKNHAVWNGVRHAEGEWLLFTDADTTHSPQSVSCAVDYALKNRVNMLTINPRLENRTFWEKVVMPIAGAVLMIRYRLSQVNNPTSHVAFGNGQFILIDKETYVIIGGHERVKANLLEDIALARLVKQSGRILNAVWGAELYSTRMFSSFTGVWNGWVRIFLIGFNKQSSKILLIMTFIVLFSFSPYLAAVYSGVSLLSGYSNPYLSSILVLSLFQLSLIFVTAWKTYKIARQDSRYAFSHLLGCIIVMGILTTALLKIIGKGTITWRSGDTYTAQ